MSGRLVNQPRDVAETSGRTPVDWLGGPALRLHATMLAGVALAAAATWFEWTRALSGRHDIAWAYSFEWPLFALMGIYLWWRLLHEEEAGARGRTKDELKHREPQTGSSTVVEPDDPGLLNWNAYLARLHAADPPGGPPA